jgi:hypothetical protein
VSPPGGTRPGCGRTRLAALRPPGALNYAGERVSGVEMLQRLDIICTGRHLPRLMRK